MSTTDELDVAIAQRIGGLLHFLRLHSTNYDAAVAADAVEERRVADWVVERCLAKIGRYWALFAKTRHPKYQPDECEFCMLAAAGRWDETSADDTDRAACASVMEQWTRYSRPCRVIVANWIKQCSL